MDENLSRRAFFRQAAAAPVAATAGASGSAELPKKAWIIVEVGWEYNDEYNHPEGGIPRPRIYFDRQQAEAECARLCAEFYAAWTPHEFEVDFGWYRDELPEYVPDQDVTWEQLLAAGFPVPFTVQEMDV